MSNLASGRILRAAIIHAITYQPNDPATMAAVDCLSESKISLDWLLDQLRQDPRALEFGNMAGLGIEYSTKKQAAVLLLTGCSYWELAYPGMEVVR